MPAPVFDVPDDRAGSAWLAREGRARQGEVLVALFSRYNHDVRTPLNTVMSWTHLLQQGKVDSARSQHVADVLARSTREQAAMLDEFVDDGRAVLGTLKLEPVALRIEDLMAQAAERAGAVAALRNVSFRVQPHHDRAGIDGDERHLRRLVHRLLLAVSSRAPAGAVIDVSSRADAGSVLLRIEGPAADDDWSDAALLDLRISSFVASLHDVELSIAGAPGRAAIVLRLPLRA
jgi:signal transduction histidine kinase